MSSRERIALSERWTKIASILPDSISSGANHPALLVEPNGFRRVVTTSLETCEQFLDRLQEIGDELEKRIPGLTSYYGLVVAPNIKKSVVRDYGGVVMVSGQSIMLDQGLTYAQPTNYLQQASAQAMAADKGYSTRQPTSVPEDLDEDERYEDEDEDEDEDSVDEPIPIPPTPEPKPKQKFSIFQKVGDIILHNNRRLGDSEVISFNRGLEILAKVYALQDVATECLTTFGALDEVLAVGKVFSYRTEHNMHYYGEHAVNESKDIQEDMVSLYNYWGVLSSVNRMRAIVKKLNGIDVTFGAKVKLPADIPKKKNNKKKKEG